MDDASVPSVRPDIASAQTPNLHIESVSDPEDLCFMPGGVHKRAPHCLYSPILTTENCLLLHFRFSGSLAPPESPLDDKHPRRVRSRNWIPRFRAYDFSKPCPYVPPPVRPPLSPTRPAHQESQSRIQPTRYCCGLNHFHLAPRERMYVECAPARHRGEDTAPTALTVPVTNPLAVNLAPCF